MTPRIPPYPLQAVLDQRLAERQRHEGAVAEALVAVQAAQEAVVAARDRYGEGVQRLDDAAAGIALAVDRGTPATEIRRHHDYVESMRRRVARMASALRDAEAKLRAANDRLHRGRTELTEASARVKLQERHRDNWLSEQRRGQRRKAEAEASEIGRLLHQRRTTDP